MSARAVAVPVDVTNTGFWSLLQGLAEQRVSECNIVAGELLWELVRSSSGGMQFTIRSARDQSDSIDCSLDRETGVLTCAPGAGINAESLTFQVLGATCWTLQSASEDCTVDQAVARMLDQLIWIEDRA